MKSKESISVKLIKYFYGIDGKLDEYRRSELNRIGNNAFIILFMYTLVSSGIMILVGNINVKYLEYYPMVNLVAVIFGVGMYIIFQVEKLKLSTKEVTSKNYNGERRKLIRRSIKTSLITTIIYYVVISFVDMNGSGSFYSNLIDWRNIINAVLFGIIFGSFTTVINYSHLKKIQ